MIENIIGTSSILFSVFLIASLSGLFAERSGTINLSINGGMIIGALTYFLVARSLLNFDPNKPQWQQNELQITTLIVSLMIASLTTMIFTTLLSFAAINLKGDQIVIGTALNILAPIISLITLLAVVKEDHIIGTNFRVTSTLVSKSSIHSYVIYIILAIVVIVFAGLLWVVINKTKFGLRLRAAGENPNALAATGVSVYTIRHMGMLISGALAGLSGGLAAAFAPNVSTYYNNVAGQGYIALAIMILGQWRAPWMVLGCLGISFLFGFANEYGIKLENQQFLLKMVPYLGTILVLPLISKWSSSPKEVGVPYNKSKR